MAGKTWSFRAYGETVVVAPKSQPVGEGARLTAAEAAWAIEALPSTTLGRDRATRADLEAIATALDGLVSRAHHMTTEALKQRVAEALRDGRLIAFRTSRRYVVQRTEQPTPLGPQEVDEHWLEIELVDQDKQPVVGEPYVIVTSDGRKIEGETNQFGRAREEGIKPGDCKVFWPSLEPALWKAL